MKIPINISNDALVQELVTRGLYKSEDIVREGNKLVTPTREDGIKLVNEHEDSLANNNPGPETTPGTNDPGSKPEYTIYYNNTEIGKVTDDSLHNEDDGMEIEGLKCIVHDTGKFVKAHNDKKEFKEIIEALNKILNPDAHKKEPWSQKSQVNPNRFYCILKELDHIDEKGNRIYKEKPQYYVNGMWCEDKAGTVECSYYDNLTPEVQKEYRAKGIIR